MNDTNLYKQILGLQSSWSVKTVTLKKHEGIIEVEIACADTVWACPECAKRIHIHAWDQRRWRHLDSCQYKTILVADVPRAKCETHGTQVAKVPWAEAGSRFTAWFERLAIDVLKECSTNSACVILQISWDQVDGIKQRAIDRRLARRQPVSMKRLCVDEKSVGWGHQYVTIVSCADGGPARVVAIEDGRGEHSLNRFCRSFTSEQRAGVETVSMDMWEAFRKSTLRYVPGTVDKIIYGNFHLPRYVSRAVDKVRRMEHEVKQGGTVSPLKGTRQLWLYGPENVLRKWAARFQELRAMATKTAQAWKVKELFRSFWDCTDDQEATAFFRDWYRQAIATRLDPVKKVARMFKRHWVTPSPTSATI